MFHSSPQVLILVCYRFFAATSDPCFPIYLGNHYSGYYVQNTRGVRAIPGVSLSDMRRGKSLFVGTILLVALAVPALVVGAPDLPQRDPRSLIAGGSGAAGRVMVGESLYYADSCPNEEDRLELCVFGPVTIDSLRYPSVFMNEVVPLIARFDGGFGPDPLVVTAAAFGDTLRVAVVEADSVFVAVIPLNGDAISRSSYDSPCLGTSPFSTVATFDRVEALLWFSCGPVALNYETGTLTIYEGEYDQVVAHPAGGVMGLKGGAVPTVGIFDRQSAVLFTPAEMPGGASLGAIAANDDRGVALVFDTPCADPCEQLPAEPADVGTPADLLRDFWIVWVGWDGVVDGNFAAVRIGTGPPGLSYATTDGSSVLVSMPARFTSEPLPDDNVTTWAWVTEDGSVDDRLSNVSGITQFIRFGWGGIIEEVDASGASVMHFWHLTDQGRFFDDFGQFEEDIEALAAAGITLGCNTGGTLFCGDEPVTRGQMASFIARWLGLAPDAPDLFDDDTGSSHEASINAIADMGITLGCSTVDPALFCPDEPVTRGQMASFIARALALPPDPTNRFTDDDGSPHESWIDAIATAGVTLGCDSADPSRYCPLDPVLRKHMAAFLVRAGV